MTLLLIAVAAFAAGALLGGSLGWARGLTHAQGAAAPQAQLEAGLTALVKGMEARLSEYQQRISQFEKERAEAAGALTQQLTQLSQAGSSMVREAQELRTALTTASGVRGRWGEQTLRNLLDACGLSEGVDYVLQQREAGGQPDFIVRLASGSNLVVDAKANLAEFLNGLNTEDPQQRKACFQRFAAVLKREAAELARRDYPAQIAGSLPLIVMFVAGEGAFRAALDADPELIAACQALRPTVLLASPSTLFPMLKVIGYGFQQRRLSEQAQQLHREVVEFGSRLKVFLGHLTKIGSSLAAAAEAYQKAVASFDARLTPQMRRLDELGADWSHLAPPKPLEGAPRALEAKAE